MSFSVQHVPSELEYNGGNVDLLFGQRRNIFRPRHWRMLLAIDRFNKEAVPALEDGRYREHTLRQYVDARGYGDDILNRYLVPMAAAVWTTPPDKMLDFPAVTLFGFGIITASSASTRNTHGSPLSMARGATSGRSPRRIARP